MKDWGLCGRCGQQNTCAPYNVERAEPTGRPDDEQSVDVCELCWQVWLKKACELFDEWREMVKP